jgi:D-alanyl-D-alanine endopeptidase (penicillin-binding protein 7)
MKKLVILFLMFMGSAYAQGSYVLFDYDARMYAVRFDHNTTRSIASITKMFTANTILNSGVDLNEKIKINGRSSGKVPPGAYMTRMDLMRAMIISSDNRASETLANHHPGGFSQFIKDTNDYIDRNLLYDTRIVDSTGLLAGNVSTARDLVEFLHQIKDNPVIRQIANERNAVLAVPRGKKTISINLRNTNPDLFIYDNILISKTGFTSSAGRCVLMLVEKNNELFAVVVLGQKNVKNRSQVVSGLLNIDISRTPEPKITSTVEFGSSVLHETKPE